MLLIFIHRNKSLGRDVLESGPPELVRLANMDPLASLNTDQVQQIEAEILSLTKSLSTCQDSSMRAVFMCRRGALLRKVCCNNNLFCILNSEISQLLLPVDCYVNDEEFSS